MPTPIVIKHRNADSTAPTTSNIIEGELAINMPDKKLYTRDDDDNIIELSNGNIDENHTHVDTDITNFNSAVDARITNSSFTRPNVTTQTGTSYTVDVDDEHSLILFTNGSAVSVTLPSDANDSEIAIGYIVHLHQDGAGTVTAVADTGVTLKYAISAATRTQYSSLSIIKQAANTYKIIGDAA